MAISTAGSNRFDGQAESGRRFFYGVLTLGASFPAAGAPFGPADLPSFTDPVTSLVTSPKFQRFDHVVIGAPYAYDGTTTANAIMATWNPNTRLLRAFTEDQTSGVITETAATTDFTLSVFPVLVVGN